MGYNPAFKGLINVTHVYDPKDIMSNFLNYGEFSNCS